MRYRYFVSYTGGLSNGFSFGNTDVSLDAPIRTYADVVAISVAIRAKHPENLTVTILNWLLFEDDPGGEAARVAPPNDPAVDLWRVRHPGIGVLTYPDETSARVAAGTAGVVYPPGESHRSTP